MGDSTAAHTPLRLVLAAALVAVAIVFGSRAASAAGSCPASITRCGCVINAPGIYGVTQDLVGTGSDCIQVGTASVVLNVEGHSITGPGAAGIHVLKGASSLMLEGHGASISGFNVGMRIEGSKVVGEHFTLSNNLAEGLAILKVKQVLISDFTASSNGASGVRITGAGTNGISNFTANGNAGSGVLVQGSGTNLIGQFTASNNSADGVFITCVPAKRGPGCGAVSAGNLVYDGVAGNNVGSGIHIAAGSKKTNFVGDNTAQNNGATDLVDDNPGCGSALLGNVWFTNTFGTSNRDVSPTCVH